MYCLLHLRWAGAAALVALTVASVSSAPSRCEQVLSRFGTRLADATCTESADLTTANPATTPANDAIATLPRFAFTPQTDRDTIAPDPSHRTPIAGPVPGVQIEARIAEDPQGQARVLMRLPDSWNGRLVVAGASGTRSEFNGDFVWSDYVVQKGYAYVSQNKGTLNLMASNAADSMACRLSPSSTTFVHFYDDDPGMPFTRWATFMAEAARLGRAAVQIHYGRETQHTYAVGTSNGGYQVRRAVESYPELFDGGVDWEGTFVEAAIPNLLSTLPPAILNYPDYVASGFNPDSTAAKNILAAGYPPDLTTTQGGMTISLWGLHYLQFWELIQPHAQHAFDMLVSAVENHADLPPSQCIPRGGTIDKNPAQPGHCTNLLGP
jgi:Tannase and feruloyl esterase